MKKNSSLLKLMCVLGTLLAFLTLFQPALAQTPPPQVSPPTLAEQIDRTMQDEMQQAHIPGAVVVVVKDGQIIFSRGYGYADLENQIPVDPATTLWRVASVTKTFTWTAVMQQVERGNLDLNADVNQYLTTFQLPETYNQPVTMAHLMAHTAGLEDNNILSGELTADQLLPLGETLAAAIPARVRAPGQVSAYSNYGAALAGYLVEQVSGVPYSQYIQENILDVLGMRHTTISEPLPSALAQDLARSYVYRAGQYQPYPYIYDRFPPAGVLNAAGEDMAAFMIAHLQNGEYQGNRILQDATARQMHARLFSQHPLLTGWAYGWAEQRINGQRVLEHDGDWQKFASELALFPDANLGIFVANNATGHASNQNLVRAVADLYFPPSESTPEAITPPAGFERRAAGYSGYYTSARASFTTIEKLTRLNGARELRVSDHGTLVSGREWVEVEPNLLRAVDQERYMVFRVNEKGRATHLFVDGGDFERLNWYETPPFSIAWVAACLAVFLGGLIYWPLFNRRSKTAAGASRAALWIMWAVCLLSLVVILTIGVVLQGDSERFTYEIPAILRIVLLLPVALHGLGLAAAWFASQAWREGWWHAPARLVYTLGVLACAAFLGFAGCGTWLAGAFNQPPFEGLACRLALLFPQGYNGCISFWRRALEFIFHEIGHVENTCNELAEPSVIRALQSRIIIHPALAEGLSGFQPGDRLLVLFVFHRIEDGYELMQRPRKDPARAPQGVFSLCSPRRPNPIGATVVDLLEIKGNVLLVAGLDAVNGTPILDIKPAFKSL